MINERYAIAKEDYANAGMVSSQIKALLKQLAVTTEVLRRIAIACYEAEINMIIHSEGGEIILTIDDAGSCILQFNDQGPGIVDIQKAMTAGYSTAKERAREFGFGAGMGLPNIKKNSDTFEIESSPDGTKLTIGFTLS